MRVPLTAAIACLTILSAGCNKEPKATELNASNETVGADSTNATATVAAPLGSADFANAIAGGGRFEIESAALAATNASSADLKSLAAQISADHKKAGEELKAAAAASSPSFTPLASLSAKQKADLAALKGVTGADFDRLYVTQQIAAHQEAVGVLTNYAAGGASPQLKDFAAKVLPIVQGHLDKLSALHK
jgi:putative membrane protein